MISLNAVKMTYALNLEGQVVSIDNAANGLECQCTCFECGAEVVARQGKKKKWHFAHHKASDKTECNWTGESELHLKVKDYLEKHKKLTVPIGITEPIYEELHFERVELEKSLRPTKRIPDVTAYCEGERILIEVRVTHEVDRQKAAEYKSVNASVIEIDFGEFELESDVISDASIEAHLKTSCLDWISVAPIGTVAMQIQDHERAVTKELIKRSQQRQKELASLDIEIESRQNYIEAFSDRYNQCRDLIHEVTGSLEKVTEELTDSSLLNQHYIKEARTAFYDTKHELEEQVRQSLKADNQLRLQRLESELYTQFEREYEGIDEQVVAKQQELAELEKSILRLRDEMCDWEGKQSKLREAERRLKKQEADLADKEASRLIAAKANASIRHHFNRIEPDLRMMCRKSGMPWPFKSSLLDELNLE